MKTPFRQNWKLSAIVFVFSRNFRIRRFLCWNVISAEVPKKDSPGLPAFLRLFESVLHALQSLCMPAHRTFCTTCTSKESNIDVTSINRGEEETWELQMYGSFCRFRISAEFSDFALKIGFRRNSIIVDQFRQNWLLNACPSKVKKNVGRIRRNCPQFRRNCPQFRRNYPDSALVTNMHSPWKPHFGRIENCRQLYLFSAEILEFGDSCAEFRQKFQKRIPQAWQFLT